MADFGTDFTPAGPLNNFYGTGNISSAGNTSFSDYQSSIFTPEPSKLQQLLQQNDSPNSALEQVKELAKNDDDWARFYYETLLNRENQQDMIKWYEDFNNSYYQRSSQDLEKAGLSPWLALQKLGMSGTGSVSPISAGNATSQSKTAQINANADIASKGIGAAATVVGALLGALVMALL